MLARRLVIQAVFPRTFTTFVRSFSLSTNLSVRGRRREYEIKGNWKDSAIVQDELDNIDALEQYINQGGTQVDGRFLEDDTKQKIESQLKQQHRKLINKMVERKYFKKPQEVNLLTWQAKEQIRYLHNEFPEEWTPELLAESFPVSLEGVHRLLNSTYAPRTEEERQRHDQRVCAHWKQLKKKLAIEGGPVEGQINKFQHIIDTGKLPLMINAGGSSSLPVPGQARMKKLQGGQRKMGVFESIVAGSQFVKAQTEKRTKENDHLQMDNEKLLKEIADGGKKTKRLVSSGFHHNHSQNQR